MKEQSIGSCLDSRIICIAVWLDSLLDKAQRLSSIDPHALLMHLDKTVTKKKPKLLKSDLANLVPLDHPLHGQGAATKERQQVATVPVVVSSAQWGQYAALATKRDDYCCLTGKEDIDDLVCSIKGAVDSHGLEQQMALLRKLLGERASLYELVGNWQEIKRLVNILV